MDINGLPHNRDITYFARTNFRGSNQLFGIKRRDRRQHMYVLGKSGTGKSALLSNMIIQNINNGEGVCVVDPHGELVEGILASIPEHRLNDVIYFNPADTDYHVGFNVLELEDERYKHLVASGLMGIFTKIWANAWSARMEYILNNAILALLDTPGTTLLGIPRLLVDKDYRKTIIGNLKDPVVKAFWVHEYEQWRDQFRNEAIAPIQNKVGQFLSSAIVRNVVGQAKSTINVFDVMNSGKIFLINVSKGRIGEDNSALLGGMLITKIQLAAMERVRVPEEERKDFYLYVDEFQNFVTDSFASILSEARKYRLNLIIAHQYTNQLVTANGTAVRDAVFGNVGTMITFRVGAQDAEFLEQEFAPEITPEDLVALPNYNIYLKLMVDGFTSRPFSATTIPPLRFAGNPVSIEKIVDRSRELYTMPRAVIEETINSWSAAKGGVVLAEGEVPPAEEISEKEKEGKFKANCAICGKEIWLPFEPTAGRPVYCREDLAKIKSGEIAPAKTEHLSSIKKEQEVSRQQEEKIAQEKKRKADMNPENIKSALNEALSGVLPASVDKGGTVRSIPVPEPILIKKNRYEVFHKPKEPITDSKIAEGADEKSVSLRSLESTQSQSSVARNMKKAGSPESVSLLKDAISKAMAARVSVAPASYMNVDRVAAEETSIESDIAAGAEEEKPAPSQGFTLNLPKEEVKQENLAEEVTKKTEEKIKEVPKDVLRKILEQ